MEIIVTYATAVYS